MKDPDNWYVSSDKWKEGHGMSWEREARAEIKAEQEKYKLEVMNDFQEQTGFHDVFYRKEFIDFLLTRMYYEGLPSREARD